MTKKKSKKNKKNRNLLKMDSNRTKKSRRRRIQNGCSGSEVRAEQSSGFNRTRKSETDSRKTAAIASYIKDPDYRLRCKAAIDILMAKLKMINAELSGQKKRTVISQTTSRIKSAESIYAKLLKKAWNRISRQPEKSEGSHRHPCSLSV